ncbi:MAG: hypothetical protein U0Q12_01105 [Vicinamibacterales bacterium]
MVSSPGERPQAELGIDLLAGSHAELRLGLCALTTHFHLAALVPMAGTRRPGRSWVTTSLAPARMT